ncbi:CLUMA_CG020462, isoform A [Clunio marinus]|uniref:Diphosphomevalonate decarboxylase n=1 Tax=Clunio marinus TaxID=568069 RepID=A0A1J1J527_9DIPT|nr:CLUMA_CG020462, isoform A [Clunio marinus]
MDSTQLSVTCIAPVNIAVIKYWGKRNESLILPINDSLSVTLSTADLCSKTKIIADAKFTDNVMILNGKEENFENERIQRCVKEIKARAAELGSCPKELLEWKIHIESENNFPTAAGLASSASGYACLVYSLAQLYDLKKQEISDIARMGSGSACRSIYGGFVQWQKGIQLDGKDSIAFQVAPASHWPDLHVLILVVNDSKKKIGSTSGMARSVVTSELIKYRVEKCVPQRIHSMTQAIKDRDFSKFAEVTMKDSNQFHAICLDTFPPCVYMNDVSHEIVNYIHEFNRTEGETKVAYTFDAGPNACLYLLEKNVKRVLSFVNHIFPNDNQKSAEYVRGIPVEYESEDVNEFQNYPQYEKNTLKYIIHTKVGEGPSRVD